ncbi:hypothetical protein Nocox_36925 [Nonomuraea coxensis DSM 45129]|uniref:HK97 gp10 family phage protein n=1 Tax=Nonomuraea coxensis DSM 45129 TaxID=1122611 RepID=A0ABX8UDZ6_9ACTN|nr:HK97-gp10 family putative phage morphogenesis protein [Nonomuraea coxensis]QYC44939.1 hypothetical protein Nocox_36925 [Nonomuraea coxensis DSM 45129]
MTGLDDLADQLDQAAAELRRKTYDTVKDQAAQLQRAWRDNARRTAGRHGKHYPNSITSEQIPSTSAAIWEIGPEIGRKQGSMGRGFEFGSVNQPPHLDGTRALTQQEPKLDQAIKDLLGKLL